MLDSNDSTDINLRASAYIIAQTTADCRSCSRPTHLYAMGLRSGHEVLEPADEALDDAGVDDPAAGDIWQAASHAALLFHVAYLSANVQRQLNALCRTYGIYNETPGMGGCWTNRCEHCGAQFDDQDLFCEPGAAFVPTSDADARRIHLRLVDEPIEARAAGYAHQPEFFDAMSRD